jgi:hypothetical protein
MSIPGTLSQSSEGMDQSGRPLANGLSLTTDLKDGVLCVKADWYWMWPKDAGEGSALILCPFMADKKGEVKGARYSVMWNRLRTPIK